MYFTGQGGDYLMEKVILEYTLSEAIADGVLHPVGVYGNKPLIATLGTMVDLSADERAELFAEFVLWQREVEPTLAEEDRLFRATASNQKDVWVIDDGVVITLLYPSEY
jgi:type I site-specific restriction endonuclease